ncbi:MAG: Rossmann-like domain-containing protein [Candidatus Nezhaarchaeales archaeon]
MLTRSILEFFEKRKELKERKVVEVGVGPLYSYARLDTGVTGIYYSFLEEFNGPPPNLQKLASGFKIGEALQFLDSDNMIERVALFASLTALGQELNREKFLIKGLKLLEILEPYLEQRVVAVIGYLAPIVHELWKREGLKVYVFERNKARVGGGVLSDVFEEKHLEEADIVIFTGASLVLPNIDRLLELSRNADVRAIVGPSASLPVEILEQAGFQVIGGSFIKNGEQVAKLVMLGAGYRTLKKLEQVEEYFYIGVERKRREIRG